MARYDIELAAYRGIRLDWVSVKHYRIIVAQTLKYIEQFGLASIDWDRVERNLPRASKVEFDLDRDPNDGQFLI